MRRIIMAFALLIAGAHIAPPVAAQPPPPSAAAPTAAAQPAAPTPADVELRERVVRLDESLKGRQDEIKRLQDEQGKLKERIDALKEKQDGFWTPFGPGLGFIAVVFGAVLTLLVYLFKFFFPQAAKRLAEEGRPALVKSALAMLEEDGRLPKLLEAHRDEIVRLVLAKDVRILIEGDEDGSLGELLKTSGYRRYAASAEHADLIVLVGTDTCEKRARELMPTAFARDQKPVVLYAPAASLDKTLLPELDKVTLAVAANTRSTAVAHVGTLAALTQKVSQVKKQTA